MTQIAAATVGGVYVPSTTPPREFAEMWFDGTDYNYNAPADFFSPPASSPRSTITEVFNGSATVNADFFGLHVSDASRFSDGVPVNANIIRLHDATWGSVGPSGRTRWSKINTSAGVYDWTALDLVVDYWYSRGHEMMYCLSPTPTWASARPAEAAAYELGSAAEPSSNTYWTDWVTAIAERYDGKIKYWEPWNEFNGINFYSGTKAKLAELSRLAYGILKSTNASNVVLSPNVTSLSGGGSPAFDDFLTASDGAAGVGADWFDIANCHLYCSASTRMGLDTKALIDAFQAVLTARGVTAPVWNTETGLLAPDANNLPDDKMKHIKRSLVIAAAMGLEHWSLYTYDHDIMGIDDRAEYAAQWNAWREILLSGAITRVNRLWDGRLACIIDGVGHLV